MHVPALQVEGSRAVVAAEEIPSFPAAVAGIVVGGSPRSPGAPVQLSASFLSIFGLGWCEQSLDLLKGIREVSLAVLVPLLAKHFSCKQVQVCLPEFRIFFKKKAPRLQPTVCYFCTNAGTGSCSNNTPLSPLISENEPSC